MLHFLASACCAAIGATAIVTTTASCSDETSILERQRAALAAMDGKPFDLSGAGGLRLPLPIADTTYGLTLFPGRGGLVHSPSYRVYVATPGGRYYYTARTDSFEYKLDYSFMPTAAAFQSWISSIQDGWGDPAVVGMALPGTFGSDGPVSLHQDKAAVRILDEALDRLKSLTGARSFDLSGVSAAGPVIAGLLATRSDVASAVIASAPFDLRRELHDRGIPRPYTSPSDPVDGTDFVEGVARSGAKIVLVGDPDDRTVPWAQSEDFATAVRKAGGSIATETARGAGPDHHFLIEYAVGRMMQLADERRGRRGGIRKP